MRILGMGIAVAVAGMAWSAEAAVMQFNYTGVLTNYSPIPQTEGDIANLDVSNRTRTGFGNSADTGNSVLYWETGYGNPTLVGNGFPAANGQVGEFEFAPAPGYTVTINSFDVGSYPTGPQRSATFSIYDDAWNVLWSTGLKTYGGAAVMETPNVSFAGTVYLQFGTDWNIGIDNIVYDVQPTGTGVVPLPATLPLLAAGVAAFGLLRRRYAS